jgi:hypothetical protein
MSRFATLLKRWIDDRKPEGINLRKLADSSELPSSDMSRIRSGDLTITQKALSKFLSSILLDRESAVAFLVAWLRDEVPKGWEDAVQILAAEPAKLREKDPRTPDPFLEAIRNFEREGETNQTVAEFIVSAWALRTDPGRSDAALQALDLHRRQTKQGNSGQHIHNANIKGNITQHNF